MDPFVPPPLVIFRAEHILLHIETETVVRHRDAAAALDDGPFNLTWRKAIGTGLVEEAPLEGGIIADQFSRSLQEKIELKRP